MKKTTKKSKATKVKRRKQQRAIGTPSSAKRKGANQEAAVTPAKQAPNPYDVFQNRRCKQKVLGERVRGEKRNTQKSRAAAASIRTAGLLRDVLGSKRTSRFKDSRLGESGPATELNSKAERSMQRLVKIRQRQAKKSFALGAQDSEVLMHGGKPLFAMDDTELRNSGGPRSDEEDADGLATKPGENDLDDAIARSKLEKAEAAKAKEDHEKMLGELDTNYTDIFNELSFRPPKKATLLEKTPEPDSYDKLFRQLAMDRRATATDRTRTPEEIAREKAQQLEELERARVGRVDNSTLVTPDEEKPTPAVQNALGYSWTSLEDVASGKAGNLIADGIAGKNMDELEDEGEDEETAGGEEGEEEETDGSEGEDSTENELDGKTKGMVDEDGNEQQAAEEDDVDDDDRLVMMGSKKGGLRLLTVSEAGSMDITVNAEGEDGLTFAPECPSGMRSLESLLGSHAPTTCLKLVQRVRARTSTAVSPANAAKLQSFFIALLDYALHIMARSDGDISARGMAVVYALRTPMLELANNYPDVAQEYFVSKLQSMGPNTLPRAAELGCLKLVTILFPVTDFQHPITTPAAVLADHWAAQIAALGASGLGDLVSDALMLWEVIYCFVVPAKRFSPAFFRLGTALLGACCAGSAAGRSERAEAAQAILGLLRRMLDILTQTDVAAARIAGAELVRPELQRLICADEREFLPGPLQEALKAFAAELGTGSCRTEETTAGGADDGILVPLRLFQEAPAQIKMLDPIFHDIGDRAGRNSGGMEMSETKLLQRRLNKERRSAMRQLSRDATVIQQLQSGKDTDRRVKRVRERKRVAGLMDQERDMIKQLATENTGFMDTSLRRYSAGKERKKQNQRMGGNATVDNRSEKDARPRQATGKQASTASSEQGGALAGGKSKKKKGGKIRGK